MKISNLLTRFPSLLTLAMLVAVSVVLAAKLQAAAPDATPANPAITEQLFASPDAAVKALQTAAEAKDQAALRAIFGPEFSGLLTGDKVQDANNAQRFAAALAQGCNQVKESDDKITLEVGTNNWPYPIPLVKADGQWHFDTAAGKDEIINRRIGKDELCAIGVCRTYVIAQRQYAGANPASAGVKSYAQKFKSTPGKKDGLYWPAAEGQTASPFRTFGGGSSCRGLRHAWKRGAASVSRLLFQDFDPAGRGRTRRENGLFEPRHLGRRFCTGGLPRTLGSIRHHDFYRWSRRQGVSAELGRKEFADCGSDEGIQSKQ